MRCDRSFADNLRHAICITSKPSISYTRISNRTKFIELGIANTAQMRGTLATAIRIRQETEALHVAAVTAAGLGKEGIWPTEFGASSYSYKSAVRLNCLILGKGCVRTCDMMLTFHLSWFKRRRRHPLHGNMEGGPLADPSPKQKSFFGAESISIRISKGHLARDDSLTIQ